MGLSSRIIDLAQVYKEDEDLVGKKAHEIGMLYKLGIPIPKGFVITNEFFKEFLRLSGIDREIKKAQALIHPAISDSVDKLFHQIEKQIMQASIPQTLSSELHKFYRKLSGMFNEPFLNVFSSAFSNKSVSFDNIKGDANLILKIKTIWSLFPEKPAAIVVQEKIASQVKGKIATNNLCLDKKLTKKQMDKLIDYAKSIQKHFYFPKEIEYVLKKGKIFITKLSPFTGSASHFCFSKILAKGIPLNPGIATGSVRILRNQDYFRLKNNEIAVIPQLNKLLYSKVAKAKAIIADRVLTSPYDKMIYKKNIKIPTVMGVKNALNMLLNKTVITVNGVNGKIYSGGLIY